MAAIVASQTMITATFQVRVAPNILKRRDTDFRVAVVPNRQAVILPTDKIETYIQGLSWSNLHSVGQLASHGWHHLRHSGL